MATEAAVAAGSSQDESADGADYLLEELWANPAAVGLGVDVCPWARLQSATTRWRGRAERIFSERELDEFQDALAIPWAAREAVLKALGLPSILGAPLAQMNIERLKERKGLRYAPTGTALQLLHERGVSVTLRSWLLEDVAIVLATCEDATVVRAGHCAIRAERTTGDLSLGARRTAERAARSAADSAGITVADGVWSGGRNQAAHWSGVPNALVSLSHDAGVVVGAALLAVA